MTGERGPVRLAGVVAALLPLVAAIGVGCATASAATLKADYQFQGTRGSSVAPAPALADLVQGANGPNSFVSENVLGVPRRVLAFPEGNGLEMSSATSLLPSRSYSVVMLVRLDQVGGFRRYLDLSGGTSDSGYYADNGSLALHPSADPRPTTTSR